MSVTATRAPVVLEPASQAFVEATAEPPFLYQLTLAEARKVLDDVQAAQGRQAARQGSLGLSRPSATAASPTTS